MNGFNHIILLTWNEQHPELDKAAIVSKTERSDISIDTIKVDISDAAALSGALRKLEEVGYIIECFFFNAARIVPGELWESVETIEEDFKVYVFVSFILRVPC